ncbi:MAG: permease-like cell division protein FtsX [Clostridiales bacterium]|jgi:cell division transport system permease protein|nr:permease-like cell division protein FtsX [Clostridiales bacterium]MDR2750102.1 permease-like cell division protein FtsX [Clostridiales bacterium]
MSFRNARYAVEEAIRSIAKNQLMTAASVITLAACLFIVSVTYCLAANIDYMLTQMESAMSITVYVSQECAPEQVESLRKKIESVPHVTGVTYVSSEEALDKFREDLGDQSHILSGLDNDNPLPRSFVLELDSIDYWDYAVSELSLLRDYGIDEVKHGKDAVNALVTVNNVLRAICLVIIAGLAIISIVIIFNTIRIAVNTRKTEINIMKYIGATDSFIRQPFIIEGMILGLLGAILPTSLIYAIYSPAISLIQSSVPLMDIDFRARSYVLAALLPLLMIMGVAMGVLGSIASIRRHLNV